MVVYLQVQQHSLVLLWSRFTTTVCFWKNCEENGQFLITCDTTDICDTAPRQHIPIHSHCNTKKRASLSFWIEKKWVFSKVTTSPRLYIQYNNMSLLSLSLNCTVCSRYMLAGATGTRLCCCCLQHLAALVLKMLVRQQRSSHLKCLAK